MVMARTLIVCILILSAMAASVRAEDPPKFRTDGGDDKLPWYSLKPGEFPPIGSAHLISGELIGLDHVNRTGVIRVDRNDSQRTDDYDKPLPFAMTACGSLRYHGAPAEIRDIPIGTHLFGLFYEEEVNGKKVFRQCIHLADDFSEAESHGMLWRITELQRNKDTLVAVRHLKDQAEGEKPKAFVIKPATRVWKGNGFGSLDDVAVDQEVLLNLTVCTIKGPGRCTDLWLDEEARKTATTRQMTQHHLFTREHGLACRVTAVDNPNKVVTVALFDGFDRTLLNEYKQGQHVAAAVAEETLRTHDQINDTMRGPIVKVEEVTPAGIGDTGLRLSFRPSELLEGFRPGRVIRLFGSGWHVDDLPREESAYDG